MSSISMSSIAPKYRSSIWILNMLLSPESNLNPRLVRKHPIFLEILTDADTAFTGVQKCAAELLNRNGILSENFADFFFKKMSRNFPLVLLLLAGANLQGFIVVNVLLSIFNIDILYCCYFIHNF
jgi:hypothetical protein